MHKILERQLKRVGLADGTTLPDSEAWGQLLERIDQAYTQMEQDRYLLERSLSVSSREMQEIYQQLDAERERLQAIITSMGDGLCALDADGLLAFVNPEGERLLGWTESELIGKPVLSLIGLSDSDMPHELPSPQAVTDSLMRRRETEFVRKGGETFPVSYALTPIVKAGELSGAVLIFRDITARKQSERQLIEARQEAEAANQAKSLFLANMSHELRTPLNSIIGYSEMMFTGMAGDLSPKQHNYSERIFRNGKHLLLLINDILDITRVEAGRLELIAKPLVVRAWLDEVCVQMEGLATAKGLSFHSVLDSRMPEGIIGDRSRLTQIAINLISNAIKFTEEGYVKVEIFRQSSDTWELIVSDTGIGVPPHAQEYIFDEFRQVDDGPRRQYGGTGLGLAIVRRLTVMMKGSVRVKSQVGEGSIFTIQLPLTLEDVPVQESDQ